MSSHLHRLDPLDVPLPVPDELFRQHLVLPRVLPELERRLRVPVIHPENAGPLGPRVSRRPRFRGLGKELQVHQRLAAVAERSADAVGAGVATADNNYGLVLGGDVVAVLRGILRM